MRTAWALLLSGLVLSGVASIVDQVVWQRALKIFLGGSETLSAMIVVLVFMLGLGVGAWLAGRVADRLRHPLAALALVELGLVVVNSGVAVLLGLDVSETVYAVQRLAVAAGVPLRATYAVGALAILLLPTVGMGATVPLASAASQRQLGARDNALVPVLFFVNTVGAAAGALGASFWLLPRYGQWLALMTGVACNALAAGCLALAARRVPPADPVAAPVEPAGPAAPATALGLRREEWIGGALGLLSLGYEMYLLRAIVLAHGPLPHTFATTLCLFLLAWSIGVFVAGRSAAVRDAVPVVAFVTAAVVAAMPGLAALDRAADLPLVGGRLLYFLPCLGFGALYGAVVARAAHSWGRDVGRFYAVNTVGSCLGILLFTLVGYELPHHLNAWILALGLAALAGDELVATFVGTIPRPEIRLASVGRHLAAVAAMALVGYGLTVPYTIADGARTWWGRDGVVTVEDDDDVYIDGLWHTRLTDGTDHVGRPYTWVMAAGAVLAHRDVPLRRALVIGAGVGISSATLAGVEGLQVDGYEINHTLQRVLRAHPDRTLGALEHPRIRWIWHDARTGLALDETRYDLILSAPLHLKQAGSSLLLSVEYLRLLARRLEPDGVVAVYSNEGSDAQALLVQRTIAEVFPHRVTWYDGLVTLASRQPITLTRDELEERMTRPDRLYREMARLDAELRAEGSDGLWSWYDGASFYPELADRPITDDQPLVEFPDLAEQLVRPVAAGSVGSR